MTTYELASSDDLDDELVPVAGAHSALAGRRSMGVQDRLPTKQPTVWVVVEGRHRFHMRQSYTTSSGFTTTWRADGVL